MTWRTLKYEWVFLRGYQFVTEKRITKSPKLYFSNTGLLYSLLEDITSGEDLKKDAAHRKGAVFENYIIAEIKKTYCNAGCQHHFSYYRETREAEIDLSN